MSRTGWLQNSVRVGVVVVAVVVSSFAMACRRGSTGPAAPCALTCVDRPGCSMRPVRPDDAFTPDPLQNQLGCGPVFVYMNGATTGVHGGFGSFCPDSPDLRKVLHDNHKHGYLSGHCESCLGVPAGWLFALWLETEGPSCPSGCGEPGVSAPLL